MIPLLFILAGALCAAPAQTISGKFVPRPPAPLTSPLPAGIDDLCALIESGHETPALFAALGDALQAHGEKALAYRAFDRAHRHGHKDPRAMQARKDACTFVSAEVIRAEETEARVWREALESYRRAHGNDLAAFYRHYGRPEDDLAAVVRAQQISWVGGVGGLLLGLAFALGMRRLPARAAFLPLFAALLCALAALTLPRTGLLPLGAAASLVGALLVMLFGRKRT